MEAIVGLVCAGVVLCYLIFYAEPWSYLGLFAFVLGFSSLSAASILNQYRIWPEGADAIAFVGGYGALILFPIGIWHAYRYGDRRQRREMRGVYRARRGRIFFILALLACSMLAAALCYSST